MTIVAYGYKESVLKPVAQERADGSCVFFLNFGEKNEVIIPIEKSSDIDDVVYVLTRLSAHLLKKESPPPAEPEKEYA